MKLMYSLMRTISGNNDFKLSVIFYSLTCVFHFFWHATLNVRIMLFLIMLTVKHINLIKIP